MDVTGIILESYPRQCVYEGKNFVEDISIDENPGDGIELSVIVGPEKVQCVGFLEQECLIVDGENFYDPIIGFDHEVGYIYSLKIARTLAFGTDDPDQIPADAGLYKYELVEVISKNSTLGTAPVQPGEKLSCVVGGCSSQLCVDASIADQIFSTCEYREEYMCYKAATCEPQPDGVCGWTQTAELDSCIAEKRQGGDVVTF